jgi:hypothetical protein
MSFLHLLPCDFGWQVVMIYYAVEVQSHVSSFASV